MLRPHSRSLSKWMFAVLLSACSADPTLTGMAQESSTAAPAPIGASDRFSVVVPKVGQRAYASMTPGEQKRFLALKKWGDAHGAAANAAWGGASKATTALAEERAAEYKLGKHVFAPLGLEPRPPVR